MRTPAAVVAQSRAADNSGASAPRAGSEGLEFDEIYAAWFHEVARWTRAFGGLDADLEDLVQEVFIVVRRKLDRFDGENLPGWLYRITQRTVSDYRRRAWFRRFWQPPNFDALVDPGLSPLETAERRQAERSLSAALSRMSAAHRSVFVLFEIEGYSGEEIARLENVPVKTVYTRLHYARKDFMSRLERQREREGRGR